jgi:hypothetical protein
VGKVPPRSIVNAALPVVIVPVVLVREIEGEPETGSSPSFRVDGFRFDVGVGP